MAIQIYEHETYKDFLRAWIQSQPAKGRGELRRMAQHLRVHPTLMSHILSGPKDLSAEQSFELTQYLQLSEPETRYFLCLVQHSKAGTKNLKKHLETDLKKMRVLSQDLSSKFENKVEMTEQEKGEFYSNWYYAAIHLASDLPHGGTVENIAAILALPKKLVKDKVEFLLRTGLCKIKDGEIRVGPAWTHIDARSTYVASHHRNWRLKAIERFHDISESELVVTAPVALSRNDALEFRKRILQLIDELKKTVSKSSSEEIMTFNLDWVRLSKS
jgi:uncharacterized protein (TIGR02147 family)